MKIIKPEPSDFPRLVEIYNQASLPYYDFYTKEQILAEPDMFIETEEGVARAFKTREMLCAKDDKNIYGFAVFNKKNDTVVWIRSIYIDPNLQNKGIGATLLEKIEQYAKDNNVKLVALETHQNAEWAKNFYIKNGYEIVNDRVSEYLFDKILEKPPVPNRPIFAKLI